MVGLVEQQIPVAGFLATFVGCALAGFGAIKGAASPSRRYFATVFLLVLSLLILPAEVGSLLYYAHSAFWPDIQVGKPWELLELQLWYTAHQLIPLMYVAFLFSWVWAPVVAKMLPKLTHDEDTSEATELHSASPRRVRVGHGKLAGGKASANKIGYWLLAIAGFLFLAVFLGYYPYFHDPSYPLVGTDIYWRNALPAERVLSSSSWMTAAAEERHPIVVLGIAVASNFSGLTIESLLRSAYVGLILAFGIAVFLLVLAGSGGKRLATIGALIVTVTAPTTAMMYTGTIAEWVAVIVWILSIASLAINWSRTRRGRVLSALGLSFGSVLVLLVHPWTWIAMMTGLVAYCLAAVIFRLKGAGRDIGPIVAAILLNGTALALSLGVLWKMQGWRIAKALSSMQTSLGSKYFGFGSWEIVVDFSRIWSQFLHPVLLILTVLGVIVLARRRDRFSAVVMTWVLATCIANLAVAPLHYDPLHEGESEIFRVMCLAPFQIPAAAGLFFLKSTLDAKLSQSNRSRSARIAAGIAVGVLFLAMLNGAFRALYPTLTDPHNHPNPLEP